MPAIATHYELVEHRLDNGLRVVVNPDPVSPAVAVNIWYQVGSRDEVRGRTGFAHLFEHLMFQGSAQVASGEHLAAVQAVGGTANATTSFDRTNYYDTVPPHALDLALWLEAERMASLAVTQANLDNQRDVVLEEKRQRYDNTPYGDLLELLLAHNFPEGHPYAHPTIGSMPDLMAAPLDWVQDFHTGTGISRRTRCSSSAGPSSPTTPSIGSPVSSAASPAVPHPDASRSRRRASTVAPPRWW